MKKSETSQYRSLKSYSKVVDSLSRTEFIRKTDTIGVRNATGKHKKMRLRPFGYKEEQLRSALIDFRKLVLQGEETQFYAICNSIELGDSPNELKEKARVLRRSFSDILNKDATSYDRNTHDKPAEVLDKWLNGKYFHQEKTKRRSLERMNFVRQVHKLVFVATVLDLSRVAIALREEIKQSLNI
jgi:hypothetical protein